MRTNFKEIKEDVLRYYEEMLEVAKRCDFPQSVLHLRALRLRLKK